MHVGIQGHVESSSANVHVYHVLVVYNIVLVPIWKWIFIVAYVLTFFI